MKPTIRALVRFGISLVSFVWTDVVYDSVGIRCDSKIISVKACVKIGEKSVKGNYVKYSVFWHCPNMLQFCDHNIVYPLRNALYLNYFTSDLAFYVPTQRTKQASPTVPVSSTYVEKPTLVVRMAFTSKEK